MTFLITNVVVAHPVPGDDRVLAAGLGKRQHVLMVDTGGSSGRMTAQTAA